MEFRGLSLSSQETGVWAYLYKYIFYKLNIIN